MHRRYSFLNVLCLSSAAVTCPRVSCKKRWFISCTLLWNASGTASDTGGVSVYVTDADHVPQPRFLPAHRTSCCSALHTRPFLIIIIAQFVTCGATRMTVRHETNV